MFDCPNCGEPVRDEAPFCPHCGSDSETGWKPDVDYYSLELPEGEEDVEPEAAFLEDPKLRLRSITGHVLLAFCFILFICVGRSRYDLWIVVPALFLMVMAFINLRWRSRPRPEKDRR